MDFLRFNIRENSQKNLDRLLKFWNSRGKAPYKFSYRIEEEDGEKICTLTTEDNESLKSAVRSFAIALQRVDTPMNDIRADMLGGKKIAKFLYPTDISTYICGYVRKDFVNQIGAQNFLDSIKQLSVNQKTRQPCFEAQNAEYKLINDAVKIKNKITIAGQNFDIEDEYYPVAFDLLTSEFSHKNSGMKFKRPNTDMYTTELRKRYNKFYNAIQELYPQKADSNFYCTNLIGDISLPSQTCVIGCRDMYNTIKPSVKTLKINT